ncbi:MAG: permease [Chloroherpetonaceae bacterium]
MFDWLEAMAAWVVYDAMGIENPSRLGDALTFFIYDTLKIFILLFLISFVMGIINSYFPIERVRKILSEKKWRGGGYVLASLFGAITPFCSCSSVPLFIGFVKGGIPLGMTLSFLITSPLVNGVALAIFIGLFGVKITIAYTLTGILLGVVAGMILEQLHLEHLLSDWVKAAMNAQKNEQLELASMLFRERLPGIVKESVGIMRTVFWYVIVGIGIGAAIHGYVPTGFFESIITKENLLAVPLSVVLAVPLYSNLVGIIPVVQAFVEKGVPIGTALAFMMAAVGLSLPAAALLKKVMTAKLLAVFYGTVTVCIIIIGYLFNWLA